MYSEHYSNKAYIFYKNDAVMLLSYCLRLK